MTRGTTPTQYFRNLPFDPAELEALVITYAQDSGTVLEKGLEDVTIDGLTIVVQLTQEDTLKFSEDGRVEIQMAARTKDGQVFRSGIQYTTAGRILHNEPV